MKARSVSPVLISSFAMPRAKNPSLPAFGAMYISARAAVFVFMGSTRITFVPFFCASFRNGTMWRLDYRALAPDDNDLAVDYVGRVVPEPLAHVGLLRSHYGPRAERARLHSHVAQEVEEPPDEVLRRAPRGGALEVHYRRPAVFLGTKGDLRRYRIERFIPRDARPSVGRLLHRVEHPVRAVNALRVL